MKHFGPPKIFGLATPLLCSTLMVNAEKWGKKIKKWGRCQLAIA